VAMMPMTASPIPYSTDDSHAQDGAGAGQVR
jgi:hypothetical protein